MINMPTDTIRSHAANLSFCNQAFINGRYTPAISGETFDCVSPVDGRILTHIAACDSKDVDLAVMAARVAFDDGRWSRKQPSERKRILLAFADLIDQHALELGITETLDMGKPIRESLGFDLPTTAKTVRWFAEAIDKIYGKIAPTATDVVALITREPIGVIAAIVPWNFPLYMAAIKFAPALAIGNSVVLKPAEQSPLSALKLAEFATEAGIPDGVFNVIPGFGETAGQALGRHLDVDAIGFTGSTEVGRLFLKYAAESNMKRVSLECGGKTPHIVMADAPNLDHAAQAVAEGVFYNQGQCCSAGSRLLVEATIKDDFLSKVTEIARNISVGDPLDLKTTYGAIVDRTQMERILGFIRIGLSEGAELKLGGKRVRIESGGCYIEPTIFDQVDNYMRVAREEIFGPVLSVLTFRDVEDAVRISNDSAFGLAAAVWTRDIDKALKTAKAVKAGSVWINNFDGSDITTPFGGYKQSGIGRDRSFLAFENYSEIKSTWIQVG